MNKKTVKVLVKKFKLDGKDVKLEIKGLHAKNVKAIDDEQGIIEAYVSVFGNVDSYGDVVVKGAFAEAVARFNTDQRYPKGVLGHDWNSIIAKTLEMRETEIGLYIKGQLILTTQKGKETYELIKAGVITDFSFGYEIDESNMDFDKGIRYLTKLTIYEWSPVLVGANPKATLVSYKNNNPEISEEEQERGAEAVPNEEQQPKEEGTEEKAKAAVGDTCEMPDGTEGILEATENGDLVCVLKPTETDETEEAQKVVDFIVHEKGDKTLFELKLEDGKSMKFALDEGSATSFKEMSEAALQVKRGRVLSAKNESTIKSAIDGLAELDGTLDNVKKLLEEVLTSVEQTSDEDPEKGKAPEVDPHKGRQSNSKHEIKVALRKTQAVAKNANSTIVLLKKLDRENN